MCKWKKCRSNCSIFVILDEICEARRTYDDFIIHNRILLNSEVLHPTFNHFDIFGGRVLAPPCGESSRSNGAPQRQT